MEAITKFIYSIVNILQGLGIFGGFVLVLLESIIPILPLALFIGVNCISYGFWIGSIISWMATITGCIVSFILFRTLFKHKFYFLFKKNKKVQKKAEYFMQKMGNMDFNALVVLIAIPFTPAFIINIAAGLSNMSYKKYICALLIGKIAIVYFWGFVGTNFIESIQEPNKIISIVGMVFLAFVASKVFENLVKVEEE